ncbi:MAG: sensor histidine kinase [Minisyncoccota bacterium]
MNLNPLLCTWDTAKFLIFSQNVFDPLIYYSHLGSFFLAAVLGAFIFFSNRRALVNQILFSLIGFFCLWIFFDLILWATEKSEYIMFVWSSMIFFDLLIYVTALYFIHVFIWKKDFPFWGKVVIGIPFIPLILLASTEYNLVFFNFTNCEREALEGMLWQYAYLVEIVYVLAIFIEIFFYFFRKRKEHNTNELLIVSSGVILFLTAFSFGNIVGSWTENWSLGQYGLFGAPIFIGLLAYAIVKFQAFDIKLLGAQALVVTQFLLIASIFTFATSTTNRILIGITLVITSGAGWLLIRSVKQEVKRREELQKLSDSLAVANDRLHDLDKAKSEFVSIASHQLRTPLTAIKGYVSLILEGSYGAVSPAIQDVMDKLYIINDRLVHLVEDLLNISRIESGRIQYTFSPTHLEPLIAELVEMFGTVAKDKHLSLEMRLPATPIPVLTLDANKMKEVISNLIDNALKYTKEGGVIVSLEANTMVARIIVADTGLGIGAKEKERLFEKFMRSQETSKMYVSGTGLGLYVGKNFVEAHGGHIHIESDGPGKGSRFIVELPFINPKIKTGTSDQASFSGIGK